MELVGESTNGIIFRRPLSIDKLKTAYMKRYDEELVLPDDLVLYQYVGMSCEGEYVAISLDNKKPSKETPFFFTNYVITESYKPNINKNKTQLLFWEDSEYFYQKRIENGYEDLAGQIHYEIQEANSNGYGWYAELLRNEELKEWRELSNDIEIPKQFRIIIKEFFIPFRISPIKFLTNRDATSDPYRYMMYENEPLFSKTLNMFQENPSLKAMGYPNWFYQAFPDVAMWDIRGDGNKIIKEMFKRLKESELISNNQIRPELLKKIIETYISKTGKKLEVSVDKK